jgi:outer membrane protein OmpA-like peptidoglycan-associated protein
MKLKSIIISIICICLLSTAVIAQFKTPKVKTPKVKAPDTSALKNAASAAAKKQFMKVAKDIPFDEASATLKLNDPNYKVQGYSIDDFMKKVFIPAMSKVVNSLPAGTKVIVIGHASSTGTEEAAGSFIGNQALSKKRANAVLNYLVKNSNLNSSKFTVEAKGSSQTLAGKDSSDPANRRVSFDLR